MDAITPGVKFGGEVTRALQISRKANCTIEQGVAVVALQKLFSISGLFIIFVFALGYLFGEVPFLSSWGLRVLMFGILVGFLLLFAAILFVPGRIAGFLQRKTPRFLFMRRVKGFVLIQLGHVVTAHENKVRFALLFVLVFIIWLLYPIKLYLLVVQMQVGVSFLAVIAVAFMAYMVAMIPIFPGGLGGFEGAMSGFFIGLGFIVSDAIAVTVVFRFITFWLVMLVGLVVAIVGSRFFNRTPHV